MMKKATGILFLLVLLLAAACATQPAKENLSEVDAVSQATPKGEGWKIDVTGVRSDELWESSLNSWIDAEPGILQSVELERKGEIIPYDVVPFKYVVAMADDADGSMPYSFLEDKWVSGYEVTLTASDGYSQTFLSSEYSVDELFLAIRKNGEVCTPSLVGNISGQYWVKDLVEITLGLQPVSLETNDFELELEIGSQKASFSLAELKSHPYYMEDRGSFTNSYGNTTENIWGGVRIVDLIEDYTALKEDQTITIEAMDGYSMDYSSSQLLDQKDGFWILAFIENGEYMPEDPGYIRLVKVGPSNPNITGHLSARMIKKILIKEDTFQDFQITLKSPEGEEIMDRQTLQSGVTTHKKVVSYFNKRKDSTTEYMGIPLYEMFSHFPGYTKATVEASDGFSITLNAEEIEGNTDVILAMYYGDGSELADKEKPLMIVWDQDAEVVPEGIKAVRNISRLIVE